MTAELTLGQYYPEPYPQERRDNPEDRRRAFDVVQKERRIGPGNEEREGPGIRRGDRERQRGLARVYRLNVPTYLLHDMEPGEGYQAAMNQFESRIPPDRQDKYFHMHFTEESDLELAQEAWRIHAEGYYAMGFVTAEAITPEGFLAEGIDKSRGPNTVYFLGLNPENDDDGATLRKMYLSPGGTYKDHPSYQACEDHLYPQGKRLLETLQEQGVAIVEIAAMAKSLSGNPASMHEVIRDAMHAGIANNEVWFFGLVSKTYDSLEKQWGKDAFTVIGDDVPIKDPRVAKSVTLRPGLLYTGTFCDNVLHAYRSARTKQDALKYRRSFIYYTEGLDDNLMSDDVRAARQEMLAEQVGTRDQ